MKNISKLLWCVSLVIIFSMAACGDPDDVSGNTDKDLPGTIAISPNTDVQTGTELTATYTTNGDEEITSWQWKKGNEKVGTNSREFTPQTSGSYTVTVSAEGYKDKTSASVTVTQYYPPLPGTVTVDPAGPVLVNTKLTATYTPAADESTGLSYSWKKNGESVGTTAREYTPTEYGVYTVTVSRGTSSKTSDPVLVRTAGMKLTTQKWREIYNEVRYTELEEGLLDLSEYICSDSATESPGLNSAGELLLSYDDFRDKPKLKIKKIILPEAATSIKAGTSSFDDLRSFKNLEEIRGANITAVNNEVFEWLDKLTTVDFPNVETIGIESFWYSHLTEVNFPKATSIGDRAFSSCANLETVVLTKAATIGTYAFNNCTSLVTVDFPEAATIGNFAFAGCTNLVTVELPKTATIGNKIFENCSKLETVTLGKITSIGINVFSYGDLGYNNTFNTGKGLAGLKTVNLPELTTIPNYVFYKCAKLESIAIPKAASVGKEAFRDCEKLGSVEFLNATALGEDAFRGCTRLASVNFPKVTQFDFRVLSGCTSLVIVEFPELLTLNGAAFDGCTNLKSVTLPKITNLAHNAFIDCTSLETIEMGAVAPILSTSSFDGITTAQTVTVKIPSDATGYAPPGTYNDGKSTITPNWANGLRGCGWENGNFTLVPGFNAAYYLNDKITIVIEYK